MKCLSGIVFVVALAPGLAGGPAAGSLTAAGTPAAATEPAPASPPTGAPAERTLEFGRFGTVHLYGSGGRTARVVLFVSGDGGWNQGVVDMARELATRDALVVGVDIRHYLAQLAHGGETCSYPAADFESLSKFVQQSLAFPAYTIPILAGYSSGATLVYATLAQAPDNTFAGAVSLGFCPDLPLTKPLCKGSGLRFTPGPKGKGYSFLPSATLPAPWVVLQGEVDQVCNPAAVDTFVADARPAEVIRLPKVGHGFSVPKNWMPQFSAAFDRLALVAPEMDAAPSGMASPAGAGDAPPAEAAPGAGAAIGTPPAAGAAAAPGPAAIPALPKLPVVEVRATQPGGDTLAVIVSGDGGWASLDKTVAGALADRRIDVVGLNSLQYFWTPRTPEIAARDLQAIVRHYMAAWGRERLLLIGYSFGADVMPFLAAQLPDDLRRRVRLVALIGPSLSASFAFHISGWLGRDDPNALPTLPQVEKLRDLRVLCLAGKNEDDSLCLKVRQPLATVEILSGGHHLGGDYASVAARILEQAAD